MMTPSCKECAALTDLVRAATQKLRSTTHTPAHQADTTSHLCFVRSKESAMWNWLDRLWRRIDGWMYPRPAPRPYRPSNLHARHR